MSISSRPKRAKLGVQGAFCSPDLALPKQASAAAATRWFCASSIPTKRFVGRFRAWRSQAEAACVDANTILFSTDFGPGTLTNRAIAHRQLWRRGETLANATIVLREKAGRRRLACGVPQRHGSTASCRAG
jgi:prolyl oligopeptidase PreP (S9A serine peptidase family)